MGSARGPGGFARVRRHVFLNQKKDRRAHWHIDYLLLDSHFRLDVAICGHSRTDVECLLAEQLCDSDSVPGFGSSDCACHSHLFFRKVNPCIEVISSFRDLGIAPDIKTIKNHG
ncbi:MAG: DUF123 domain-containing protein [Methanomicrobiales archaeon]|nr:DUF123 domain-containing protein [Methanomicrobiales archaeon]